MESIAYEHRKIFQININAEKLITHSRESLFCDFTTLLYNIHPKKWADVMQNVMTPTHPEMEGSQK